MGGTLAKARQTSQMAKDGASSEVFSTINLEDLVSSSRAASAPEPPPAPAHPEASPPLPPSSGTSTSRKRKRDSSDFNFEAALAVLDRRRAEREAGMEASRQRRESLLQLNDRRGCYVLHVADVLRSLPPHLLPECQYKIETVLYEMQHRAAQFSVSLKGN